VRRGGGFGCVLAGHGDAPSRCVGHPKSVACPRRRRIRGKAGHAALRRHGPHHRSRARREPGSAKLYPTRASHELSDVRTPGSRGTQKGYFATQRTRPAPWRSSVRCRRALQVFRTTVAFSQPPTTLGHRGTSLDPAKARAEAALLPCIDSRSLLALYADGRATGRPRACRQRLELGRPDRGHGRRRGGVARGDRLVRSARGEAVRHVVARGSGWAAHSASRTQSPSPSRNRPRRSKRTAKPLRGAARRRLNGRPRTRQFEVRNASAGGSGVKPAIASAALASRSIAAT
jgi:hypothetical protein